MFFGGTAAGAYWKNGNNISRYIYSSSFKFIVYFYGLFFFHGVRSLLMIRTLAKGISLFHGYELMCFLIYFFLIVLML